jgi:hypothetical protein
MIEHKPATQSTVDQSNFAVIKVLSSSPKSPGVGHAFIPCSRIELAYIPDKAQNYASIYDCESSK